jgi:hypothetical protein
MKAKKPARATTARSARSREDVARSRVEARKKQTPRRAKPVREKSRSGADPQPRGRKQTRETRPNRSAPRTTPIQRPADHPARPKSAGQAKARAKARKAKAPKVVRPPLRQRVLVRLSSVELDPRRLVARVPFVVLVIGALGLGRNGPTAWATPASSIRLCNSRRKRWNATSWKPRQLRRWPRLRATSA